MRQFLFHQLYAYDANHNALGSICEQLAALEASGETVHTVDNLRSWPVCVLTYIDVVANTVNTANNTILVK